MASKCPRAEVSRAKCRKRTPAQCFRGLRGSEKALTPRKSANPLEQRTSIFFVYVCLACETVIQGNMIGSQLILIATDYEIDGSVQVDTANAMA